MAITHLDQTFESERVITSVVLSNDCIHSDCCNACEMSQSPVLTEAHFFSVYVQFFRPDWAVSHSQVSQTLYWTCSIMYQN